MNRGGRWAVAVVVATAVATGASLAVARAQQPPAKKGAGAGGAGGAGAPRKGRAEKKAPPNAGDPLARQVNDAGNAAGKAAPPAAGTYHYKLKVRSFDGTSLAAAYYPAAKLDANAPVALLVHEKDRSSQDFQDVVPDLKTDQGLAEHLQSHGYAVMLFDLRGHGANPRRALGDRDWRGMVDDLQSVYQFLVDRHNRGELNLAKLGVVALGQGANLVAAWAYQPGGAVSSEGRSTDLSGLALISPEPEGVGYSFPTVINALSTRVPVLLEVGERDNTSHEVVRRVKANVERTRQNKVELFPTSLRGYKLLTLEPRAASTAVKFLDATVKLRATEWEPRYNLTPVTYSDIQIVRHAKAEKKDDAAKKDDAVKKDDAAKKEEPPKDEEPAAKPKGKGSSKKKGNR